MDTIFINDLVYAGTHGVHPDERHTRQRFSVSVRLDLDTARAGASDNLSDTHDYAQTRDIVRGIIEGNHCYLIERLARHIADTVLTDMRIHLCRVTIKKLDIWGNGVPGVVVERKR
jgi:dihydroneopterin aldolase